MLHSGIMSDDYRDVRRKAELLLEAERLFLAQKAKCKYLNQGDRCTKFFHDLIKRNNKRNAIVTICKRDGSFTVDGNEIANEFVNYYKSILGSKIDRVQIHKDIITDGPCVSENDWSGLLAPVTMDEVRTALFDIYNDKAPGSDGFGSFFFKSFWDIIGIDVFAAMHEFFLAVRGF